jgi:ATP-binding cassette subfamily B protein
MCGTLADLLLKKVIDGLTLNQITLIRAIIYLSIYTILRLSWQIFAPIRGRLQFVVFSKNAWKDRIKLFEYTAKHHSEFFINNFAGSIHNKINDAVNCSNQILREIMSFSSIIINALLILGIFCAKSVILAIYILFFLLIYALLYGMLMKDMKKISAENAEAHSILNGKMIDSLSSMWIVKMFSRESFEKLTLEKEVIHTMRKTYGLIKLENKMSILTFISFFIVVLGISIISLKLLFAKTITLGDFIFNINSTGTIMWDVHYLLQRFSSAVESYGKGQNALDTLIVSHIVENHTTNKINVTDGNIIVKNMSFQYKPTLPYVFKDFNLNIKSNQKVGIVGYSGAGKSTLVNLLLRFYDVTDGEIHIDDQNIKTGVTQESLRNNISYIAQDPTLFHRSIKDNILYGKLTASEDELIEVAKKSCCYDFIMSLENKFDTLVGERGVKLSGGQRQ